MIMNCFHKKRNINVLNPHHLMDRASVVWVLMKRNGGKYEYHFKRISQNLCD